MKKLLLSLLLLTFAGCGNLSPRFDPQLRQQIDNQNGRIDEIENNQNSIKNELRVQGEKIQQGIINEHNENSGIQILSGNGGLFLGLTGILSLFIIMLHYRQRAVSNEKAATLLADQIVSHQDPSLEDEVFKAAMYTDVEETVYNLVTKSQKSQSI